MTTPSTPTVLDELRKSAVGPYLDTPIPDVLQNLGLPQLPQLPNMTLPDLSGIQLPTLPSIDPTALIQPVVSLLQSFGTGSLGNSSFNPASILTSLVSALTSAASQSKAATSTVMNTWTGDAAVAAQNKSDAVEAQSGEVAAQGAQQHGILLSAEAIVAEGYAEISAVIAKFVAAVSAGIAMLATPAGIPWLIATATDAISEGTAIAAKTSVQLAGSTAEIAAAGTKIMIAGAPIASNIADLANMVGTALQPIASVAPTVATNLVEKGASVVSGGTDAASQIGQNLVSTLTGGNNNPSTTTNNTTKTNSPTTVPDTTKTDPTKTTSPDTTKIDGGGMPPGTIIGGGVPNTTSPSGTLTSARVPTGEISPTGAGTPKTATEAVGRTTASPNMSPAGGAAGRAGAADEESTSDRSNLVTGAHGDEVVGVIEGVVLPVVGAIEAIDEPPDKALTL
ncbi:hypothetical protein ACIP5Y_43365 [Nocardia sp. NPDC088792]|uniref:hypothetical protein n=1 Tax=Nocardia sp. NPDC088792 TaxID=3364332 RepID=UPI003807EC08